LDEIYVYISNVPKVICCQKSHLLPCKPPAYPVTWRDHSDHWVTGPCLSNL